MNIKKISLSNNILSENECTINWANTINCCDLFCYNPSNFMALTISLSIRQDIYWIVSERREN